MIRAMCVGENDSESGDVFSEGNRFKGMFSTARKQYLC